MDQDLMYARRMAASARARSAAMDRLVKLLFAPRDHWAAFLSRLHPPRKTA